MMLYLLQIFGGLVLAGVGGEIFLKGAIGISHWLRIPSAIIGLTIAAFATSSPELSVGVMSALAKTPELSLGDVLGSNVVNLALILGIAAVISPTPIGQAGVRRDIPFALAQPILLALLSYDGQISAFDGVILLGSFLFWLWLVVQEARAHREQATPLEPTQIGRTRNTLLLIIGLGMLLGAGKLIVLGAEGIGVSLGLSPLFIGATMVAFGTSVPELATTVISKLRGHADIGLGTVLGSNIFNGLFIVAVASIINPITVSWRPVLVGVGFGLLATLAVIPYRGNILGRNRGVMLLSIYVAYVFLLIACRIRP